MGKKNSNELKEERADLNKEVDALLDKEEPTDDEVSKIIKLQEQIKDLNAEIVKTEQREQVEALKVARSAAGGEVKTISQKEEKDLSKYSLIKLFKEASSKQGLTGLEEEMNQEAQKEALTFGKTIGDGSVALPSEVLKHLHIEQKAMSVGSDPDGGSTVRSVSRGWIDALRDKTVLANMGATFLSGLTSDVDFDRQTSEVTFSWLAENAGASESTPKTDKITMKPNRLSGYSRLGTQLLHQSSPDIEQKVRDSIIYGQARAFDLAGINGSGTGAEPRGILNVTGVNSVATGALLWPKIVELETAVANDNADVGSLGYVFNTAMRGELKTTQKFSGTNGISLMENNEVNGYKTGVTNLTPASKMIFGNWKSLLMGQWGGLEFIVDPYTRAKEAQVDIVMHFFGDVAVEHPESFSVFTKS